MLPRRSIGLMARLTFNARTLATLKGPSPGEGGAVQWEEHFDKDGEGGLYLRASSTGARTWMLMSRVWRDGQWKLAKFKLGAAWSKDNPKAMSLSAARTAAAALKTDLKAKIDPAKVEREREEKERAAAGNTFKVAVETFLTQYPKREKLRPATERQYRDFLEGDFATLDS